MGLVQTEIFYRQSHKTGQKHDVMTFVGSLNHDVIMDSGPSPANGFFFEITLKIRENEKTHNLF